MRDDRMPHMGGGGVAWGLSHIRRKRFDEIAAGRRQPVAAKVPVPEDSKTAVIFRNILS